MLVYVLIHLSSGVLADCVVFEDYTMARKVYTDWSDGRRFSDHDAVLVKAKITTTTNTESKALAFGEVVAESYGEG